MTTRASAVFDGPCASEVCETWIKPDDPIRWTPHGWVHDPCPDVVGAVDDVAAMQHEPCKRCTLRHPGEC